MLLLYIRVLSYGIGVCNAIAVYMIVCYAAALVCVMLLLCMRVIHCGVGVCNAAALKVH